MKGLDPVQDEMLEVLKHIRSNTTIMGACMFIILAVLLILVWSGRI